VEQHLADCASCRQTHLLLQATAATLAARGPAEPPDGLAERAVRAAFTAEPARASDWLGQLAGALRWPALGTATAAAVLAVGLLTSVPDRSPDAGVSLESIAAIFATDNDVVSDRELLSDVLGQEEE
jgi:anti-sigma factor RsiW